MLKEKKEAGMEEIRELARQIAAIKRIREELTAELAEIDKQHKKLIEKQIARVEVAIVIKEVSE
jgi:hypothetical protein